MADHAVIETDRALVFGNPGGLRLEAGDDVVAVLLGADGVGQLTDAPRRVWKRSSFSVTAESSSVESKT
jgi:hypothetical protein